jgi:hypothetical protein
MNSLSFIASLAGLALGAGVAVAGTVTVSFTNDSTVVNQAGLVLQNGYAVRVGTFLLPDATRNATLAKTSDYAQLQSWFKPLGEGIAGAGTISQVNGSGTMLRVNGFPEAGNVFGGISGISDSYMTPGTPLYIWIFDNADPTKSNQWGIYTGATWVLPQPLGTQTLSGTGTVSSLQGSSAAGVLSLGVPKPTFGNWTMKAFASGTAGSALASTADPDGDGIANLAEYAWQLDPNAKSVPPVSLAKGQSGNKFTFLAPRNLSDVQVTAEYSTDLKTWNPAASTILSSDSNFDTCQCGAPNGATKCFWRVRVTSVTPTY